MSGTRELVFVYGTLRRGGTNHFRMSGADLVAEGTVKGRIYRISWYPGLVLGDEGEVKGEVYSVDAAQLLELDAFEGLSAGEIEGSEYRRVKSVVSRTEGGTLSAWVWEWIGPFDAKDLLAQGDWIAVQPGDE
ncbi:gamma-glutamylcyclotransferase [Luteolibacter sp. SL250]|uniref:gamma-glutamylcyclotransferase family protein n=1 Tax=Luteolibacter sp. SL250 TaxID=2995170 RepID=UPI00227071E6|nr:gamma-glutamylcyclotransferase family protein [Luteolibacter sp. SL250]WAC17956.1 gamma-glutamylcyclotransferase [Luteolibacter sp. SL250]